MGLRGRFSANSFHTSGMSQIRVCRENKVTLLPWTNMGHSLNVRLLSVGLGEGYNNLPPMPPHLPTPPHPPLRRQKSTLSRSILVLGFMCQSLCSFGFFVMSHVDASLALWGVFCKLNVSPKLDDCSHNPDLIIVFLCAHCRLMGCFSPDFNFGCPFVFLALFFSFGAETYDFDF